MFASTPEEMRELSIRVHLSHIRWRLTAGVHDKHTLLTFSRVMSASCRFHKRDVVINYDTASLHAWLVRQGIQPDSFELTAPETQHMTHMYPLDTIEDEWNAFVATVSRWWTEK